MWTNRKLPTASNGSPLLTGSPETNEEFRAHTSTYPAEYGRESGTYGDIATKGVANAMHGSLFEFFRNNALSLAISSTPSPTHRPRSARLISVATWAGPSTRTRRSTLLATKAHTRASASPALARSPAPCYGHRCFLSRILKTMKLATMPAITLSLVVSALSAATVSEAQRAAIDQNIASKGVYTEAEDTYKVTFPRTDVKVTVEGRPMPPFMGFSSWAAFTPGGHGELIVMGDVVLLEDEVNPAMSAALDSGLEVTALHNHFFYESPRVMYMHIGGTGSADQLAASVRRVLDAVTRTRVDSRTPAMRFPGKAVSEKNAISAVTLDMILNVKGESNNGMYKATIGRSASMHGAKVGKQMGVNTWAAFAGTEENALVDGDFAMTKQELQVVLKSLRKSGINIVAIHNHMTHEEPQYVFLHYWGKGPASHLATAVKRALDQQSLTASAVKEVLFVCEHGSAKSVLAAAEFNRLAKERGLALTAVSKGVNPDVKVAPVVAQSLARDGMTVKSDPSAVTRSDIEQAGTVVTMGCKLSPSSGPRSDLREWNDVPSVSADVEVARADIRRRVSALLDELTLEHKAHLQ